MSNSNDQVSTKFGENGYAGHTCDKKENKKKENKLICTIFNLSENNNMNKKEDKYDMTNNEMKSKCLKNPLQKIKGIFKKKRIVSNDENQDFFNNDSKSKQMKYTEKEGNVKHAENVPAVSRQAFEQKINSTQSTMNIDTIISNSNDKNQELNKDFSYEHIKNDVDISFDNIEKDRENMNEIDADLLFNNAKTIDIPNDDIPNDDLLDDQNLSFFQKCKLYFSYFGPGWIVAIAYLDPGNLCSNFNVGLIRSDDVTLEKDYSGYYLLWIMIYGHLLGFLFQILSMKIGHITGLDLATICYKEFNRKLSFILYILVQTAVWGAHIQAIVGTFVAINLIFGIPVKIGIFYTLIEAIVYIFLEKKSTKLLENVLSCLIGILACCFFVNVFLTSINFKQYLLGIIYPRIPKGKEIDALALLGSIISAHIFYLHTSLTSKKKVVVCNINKIKKYNILGTIESGGALFLSCLTNCIIVLTFAEVDIKGSDRRNQYTLFTAYEVLKKSFGYFSVYIWSFGLLSSGNNSSFMCEYATKSVFEGFLNKRINTFIRVLLFRSFLFFIIYMFFLYDKYTIDQLTNFINVIQVLLLPLAIVPLYKFCSDKKVLGEEFALKKYSNILVLIIIIVLIFLNLILTIINILEKNSSLLTICLLTVFVIIYLSFILYIFCLPIKKTYYKRELT